jgi:hypothetical protein
MYSFPEELPKIGQIVQFVFEEMGDTITMEASVKARSCVEDSDGQIDMLFALSTTTEQTLCLRQNHWRLRRREDPMGYEFIDIAKPEILR